MKRINLICTLIASTLLLTNCQKKEVSDETLLNNNSKNQASGADGEWDVLGYGIDATANMLETNSMSDVSIINIYQYANDFKDKNDPNKVKVTGISVNRVGGGSYDIFTGYSAHDYSNDVNTKKSIGVDGKVSVPFSSDPSAPSKKLLNFTGNFSKNSEDENKTSISSKFSYAMFEYWHRVKRIGFTEDVTTQTLLKYLTPEFKNYIATKTATEIVNRYGTHVLLDISLGSRIRIDYSGEAIKETSDTKKISTIKAGLGVSVLDMFGFNINTDKTKEEVTRLANETIKREYHSKYYGGNNTGTSISIDSEGKSSSNFNLTSWQQGVTERNAALISIDKALFIYDFITDPVKKAQVKTAVEKYIKDRQPIMEPDYTSQLVSVKSFIAKAGKHHYLTTTTVGDFNYWREEGPIFKAYNKNIPGTVPIYAFHSQGRSSHFYTTTSPGGDYNWWAWKNEGVAFYAYKTQVSGSIPIYEHYSSKGLDHYYSPDPGATLGDPSYWTSVSGPVFYAYPLN
ncbi:MAC/perforin domain-containing protein [Sphingobacterium sp. ML3W]|uniref:MAC/perforin domain-containing protein n=1 Tax=Sphingobacterium sp. ML3W TaxID=1538644 RepID=UPI000ABBBD63|nr:MAC/perforin domain-containing protein [Sphingobacterium sp. ML3W]